MHRALRDTTNIRVLGDDPTGAGAQLSQAGQLYCASAEQRLDLTVQLERDVHYWRSKAQSKESEVIGSLHAQHLEVTEHNQQLLRSLEGRDRDNAAIRKAMDVEKNVNQSLVGQIETLEASLRKVMSNERELRSKNATISEDLESTHGALRRSEQDGEALREEVRKLKEAANKLEQRPGSFDSDDDRGEERLKDAEARFKRAYGELLKQNQEYESALELSKDTVRELREELESCTSGPSQAADFGRESSLFMEGVNKKMHSLERDLKEKSDKCEQQQACIVDLEERLRCSQMSLKDASEALETSEAGNQTLSSSLATLSEVTCGLEAERDALERAREDLVGELARTREELACERETLRLTMETVATLEEQRRRDQSELDVLRSTLEVAQGSLQQAAASNTLLTDRCRQLEGDYSCLVEKNRQTAEEFALFRQSLEEERCGKEILSNARRLVDQAKAKLCARQREEECSRSTLAAAEASVERAQGEYQNLSPGSEEAEEMLKSLKILRIDERRARSSVKNAVVLTKKAQAVLQACQTRLLQADGAAMKSQQGADSALTAVHIQGIGSTP